MLAAINRFCPTFCTHLRLRIPRPNCNPNNIVKFVTIRVAKRLANLMRKLDRVVETWAVVRDEGRDNLELDDARCVHVLPHP